MWQRFTERARKVVFYAQEEAQKAGGPAVNPEHLMLGLLRETESTGCMALRRIGVDLDALRSAVRDLLPLQSNKPTPDMTLATGSKHAISLAYDEARSMNDSYIGTEHLLLGLARLELELASTFRKFKIDLDGLRTSVRSLNPAEKEPMPESPPAPPKPEPPKEPYVGPHVGMRHIVPFLFGDCLRHHLFLALTGGDSKAAKVASKQCEDIVDLRWQLWKLTGLASQPGIHTLRADNLNDLLARVQTEAGSGRIRSEHLLLALVREDDSSFSQALVSAGLSLAKSRELAASEDQ